jgi:PAS domain S-box-containing protein
VATTERDFWDVFARSASPMLVVDDQRATRAANPAACRLLRRASEEIVGRDLFDFIPPSRVGELEEAWVEFLDRGHAVRDFWLADADGQTIEVGVAATADTPEPGRHFGVLVPTEDHPPGNGRPRLSPRESEITRMLALGFSGERIARELFLSPETVRTHIRNAMDHAGARTRAHLVAVALRESLIEL